MSDRGESRPDDPAGTRPKVDPEALRAPAPPRDLPWAEREDRAESRLEASIARFDEVHVEQEQGESEHVGRFQFILGGLIAVGVIAVAAIVIVIAAGRTDQPDASWSAWRPTGDDPLQQIASHVGATYRLDNGDQIAAVTGGPLQIDTGDGSKASAHVVRQDPRTQNLDLENGKTALFNLCGTGKACTFAGTPSGERLLFVRREALELALYALHYTDVDQVVVTFPTLVQARTAGATPQTVPSAIFIRRDQVQAMLDRPLGDTLSSPAPSIGAVARSTAAGLLQRLPSYAYQLEPAADLSVLFMLSDLASTVSNAAGATTTTPQTGAPAQTTPTPSKRTPGKKGG